MHAASSIILHGIGALTCFGLALVVLYQNPYRRCHVAFSALASVLGLWSIGVILITRSTRVEDAIFWIRMTFVVVAWLPVCFHYFVGVFPRTKYEGPRWFLYTLLVAPVVLIPLAFSPWYILSVEIPPDGPPITVYGPVFLLYGAVIIATMLWSFPMLFSKRRLVSGLERRQVEHVILGISVCTITATVTNVVMPALGFSHWQVYGPIAGTGMMAIFAYSMVRYHLMDVRLIVSRTTVYAGAFAFVIAAFSGAVAATHWLTRTGKDAGAFLPTFVAALIVVLVLEPLKERLQLILDRTLLKRRYNSHEFLARVSRNAARTVQLDELLETVCRDIERTVGVKRVRVLLRDDKDSTVLITAYATDPEERGMALEGYRELLEYFERKPAPVLLEQLIHSRVTAENARLAEHLAELEAHLCAPLISKWGLVGLLVLGEKISRDMYVAHDAVVFSALASPVAAAIENARLYQKLEEATLHRERILTTMQSGVISVSAEGQITTVNHAAKTILGDVDIGQSLETLPAPISYVLKRTLREQKAVQGFETLITGRGKEQVPVAISSAPLPGAGGVDNSGAMVMVYDLTQLKRLERNVQRAHKLSSVGMLAAGMAHEIKNPLVSIKTLSQLLPHRFDDADFRATFAEVVPAEVDRIDAIVSRLLDFARPKPSRYGAHDVRTIVDKVLLLVENQIVSDQIDLTTDYADDPLVVRGDDQQLHQVFLNLVLNAIDSMKGKSTRQLIVRAWRDTMTSRQEGYLPVGAVACVKVSVTDTGCGIPPDEVEGIYTPFFTTKESGTGLGLSVVHGIVTDHGGHIDLESTPDEGTTFTISLPAAENLVVIGEQ